MTQEKELQSARYGFWGYLVLIVGLAGITAFLLFINQDALLKYGLTYRQIWSVWGGVFSFLFLHYLLSFLLALGAKKKTTHLFTTGTLKC